MTGVPIMQTDMHGRPIMTGDTLVCYPEGLGQAVRFVVAIGEHGLILPPGVLPSDLGQRCEIVGKERS